MANKNNNTEGKNEGKSLNKTMSGTPNDKTLKKQKKTHSDNWTAQTYWAI